MAGLNFDVTNVPQSSTFEPIPAGWYNAMIDDSEVKATSKGGSQLNLRFTVLDGEHAGRKIFTRLNLWPSQGSKPVTLEIAKSDLSAIGHAIGVLNIADSSQLHGVPMKIKVNIRKDVNGQYEDQNGIRAFKNINYNPNGTGTAGPAIAGAPTAPQMPTAPAGFGAPAIPAMPSAPAMSAPAASSGFPPASVVQQAMAQAQTLVQANQASQAPSAAPATAVQPPQWNAPQPWDNNMPHNGTQGQPSAPQSAPATPAPAVQVQQVAPAVASAPPGYQPQPAMGLPGQTALAPQVPGFELPGAAPVPPAVQPIQPMQQAPAPAQPVAPAQAAAPGGMPDWMRSVSQAPTA